MFFYNLRWQWDLFRHTKPQGVIFHPIGIDQIRACKRNIPEGFPETILIDPDIYFWKLNYEKCGKFCRNISTYDYVPLEVPKFDREKYSKVIEWLKKEVAPQVKRNWPPNVKDKQEIKDCIDKCLKFQEDFGAYRLILPSLHICDVSDDLSDFLLWLDSGLEIIQNYKTHSLALVSISDICLFKHYETILDHITAREGIKGIYISIENSISGNFAPNNYNVAWPLLDISYIIGSQKNLEVYVNFADVFGLACLAVGATAFASGYESKARCLNFGEFVEKGSGGGALPRFFSLTTTKMYRVKKDLKKIRDKRLLRIFENDRTQFSSPLFNALEAGQDADSVPSWKEEPNNIIAARLHFIEVLKKAADHIKAISEFKDKVRWGLEWLQDAESKNSYFDSVFKENKLEAEGGDVKVWRSAFENLIEKYKLI